jgi:AcrR family transcriptional regulator
MGKAFPETATNAKIKSARTQEERNAIAKAKLCEAALELIALQGYDTTTLADIGVRAGYSRSLAQYHFGTKTVLAVLLLEEMGRRDTQTHVLKLPADATGTDAWRQLHIHLEDSWQNFCAMHDGSDSNLAARGEMILCATATFSPDPVLREKLNEVSRVLTSHVAKAVRLCIRDGVLRADLNANNIALFYVTAIWGMVNALFADPVNKEYFSTMKDTLMNYLETLRK